MAGNFMPMRHVRLCGLSARDDLNGCTGKLLTFDPVKARWRVEVESGECVRVRTANLEAVKMKEGLSTECSICLEPFMSNQDIAHLGCGHALHQDCLYSLRTVHRNDIVSSLGEAGQTAQRCPVCRAWHGKSGDNADTWWNYPAFALINQMLGYIFQRRWQSQGQDRSAAEEMVFIEERFGRAYAAGQAEDQLRALDAALKRLRANFRQNGGTGHIDDTVGADFTDAFASAAVVFVRPTGPSDAVEDSDSLYWACVPAFLQTLGMTPADSISWPVGTPLARA